MRKAALAKGGSRRAPGQGFLNAAGGSSPSPAIACHEVTDGQA
ncbi:hypothetical protein CLV77_3113 [Brevirhabdus pacifica]|nr:hypothetical protein CLV77_3113 [Brevirhabdus pacifica]